MNNFFIRTLSGIVYAALVVGAIFGGPLYFSVLALFFLIFSTREFHKLTFKSGEEIDKSTLLLVNLIAFLIPTGILLFNFRQAYLLLLFALPVLLMIYLMLRYKTGLAQKTSKLIMGITYLSLPFSLLLFLFYPSGDFSAHQIYPLLGLFIILWVNDSLAYITGSLVGRTRLIERISPKKTWEGSFGGLLFSFVAAWLLSIFFTDLSLMQWLGFALITVIFGTFGDLFESTLKRNVGVKESGTIIPGHGGMLDRLDSLLFTGPAVYLYLMIILNL